MRQLLIGTLVLVFLGSFAASHVEAAKIKHLKSLYTDSAGDSLKFPEGVACDETTLVVADTGNSRVVIYAQDDQTLAAKSVFSLDGIAPIIVQMSSRGDLYLLDGKDRSIKKLEKDGTAIVKLKPTNLPNPQNYVPRSFRIDRQDNFYLLDIFAKRVLILDSSGQYLKHLPFPPDFGFFSDLAISPQGAVYLLDSVAGAIYAANPGSENFSVLSQGLKDHMNFPTSIAIDDQGTFYLSDQYGSGLALVARDGSFLGRKFGLGWEDGQLYYPSQICIDERNRLFVADRNNNRVQVFSILDE